MAIKSIKLNTTILRIIAPVLAVICVISAYFSVKWFFANTIASRAVSLIEKNREVADFAVGLAPEDPETHLASAVLYEKTFLPDDLPKSLAEYEQAVALSPSDFRLWFELGKARERNGDVPSAEAALRKALELAPNYSQVQWALGNFLLREGKSDEAFAEIRKAAKGDKTFANPAIAGAWQLFQGDMAQIKKYVGDSVNLKAALASVLAAEKRFDEALEIWNSLPEDARKTDFKSNGDEIYQKMLEAKKYRAALQIYSQIAATDENKFALGRITNGGFETDNPKTPSVFEWQIAEGIEPQIGVDNTQRHGGNISLKLIFNDSDGKSFRNVSQTIAVEANKKYVFETFYKSELKTATTVKWEIVDAADGKVLASTEAIAANADWASLKTEFAVPETTEAVTIRLVRVSCITTFCPISGKLWFDDFSLNG
ncbi:MAG: tetratricopeptide repeat protein [Actinomycetota bacterium]